MAVGKVVDGSGATIEVELRPVRESVVTGVWCDTCLLPSAITVDLEIAHHGSGFHRLGNYTYCPDHEGT